MWRQEGILGAKAIGLLGTRGSSRWVAPQVLLPLQRFTSKFGMDWRGPIAASAPRRVPIQRWHLPPLSSTDLCVLLLMAGLWPAIPSPSVRHSGWAGLPGHCALNGAWLVMANAITGSNSLGLLVCLGCNHCWPCTWHLSNSLSCCDPQPQGQRALILGWASYLDAFSSYPLRTWLPSVSPWQENWHTRGASLQVLSYYGGLPSML